MHLRLHHSPWLALCVLLSGCLPSSCNRDEPRALFPADSLSRAYASELPVDTLRVVGSYRAEEGARLTYPRSVRFAPGGQIWVTDTGSHTLFSLDDSLRTRFGFVDEFPYLAGFVGEDMALFSPINHHIRMVRARDSTSRTIELPGPRPPRDSFSWAAASDSGFAVKVIAPDFEGYLARFDTSGAMLSDIPLPQAYWRYAGGIHFQGDDVVSLSGYKPVLDLWTAAGLDSLALFGFDSPMLPRTRQFVLGSTHQPPLLSAAAVPMDSLLFAMNMRPGWLRIDVYDGEGRLQYILTEPDPEFNQDFLPTDLAVRRSPEGGYEIAVTVAKPEPGLDVYRWQPGQE